MNNFNVEVRKLKVAEYQFLRGTTNWFSVDDKAVEHSLANDLFSVCVFDNDRLIGMGRIVGDGAIYFYIQDIIVIPTYQKKGVGKLIMNEIEAFIENNAFQNSFVGLMAAEGVQEFYHRYGYIKRPDDQPGMYKLISK